MATFFATLNLAEKKPGILRVLDDYAANFIPISQQPQFPSPLGNLFDPDTYGIGYLDLLERCESAFDKIVVSVYLLLRCICTCRLGRTGINF